jgi:hypothetical protein
LIPLERSLQSYIRRTIEEKSDIRLDALRGEVIEAINPLQVYLPAITLIGDGSITETIAKNDPSPFKKGLNNLFHMLRPCRFIKEEFGRRHHVMMVRVEKDFPYFFADRAPPWFSGYFAVDAFLGEIFFQALNLSGLPAPLHAFESNKERQLYIPPNELKSLAGCRKTLLPTDRQAFASRRLTVSAACLHAVMLTFVYSESTPCAENRDTL